MRWPSRLIMLLLLRLHFVDWRFRWRWGRNGLTVGGWLVVCLRPRWLLLSLLYGRLRAIVLLPLAGIGGLLRRGTVQSTARPWWQWRSFFCRLPWRWRRLALVLIEFHTPGRGIILTRERRRPAKVRLLRIRRVVCESLRIYGRDGRLRAIRGVLLILVLLARRGSLLRLRQSRVIPSCPSWRCLPWWCLVTHRMDDRCGGAVSARETPSLWSLKRRYQLQPFTKSQRK